MKQPVLLVLFLLACWFQPVQAASNRLPVLNTLEDFFKFENVEQLTTHFGAANVFTEQTYYGDPNKKGKPYLHSEVNFGTSHSVLVIWNNEGNQVCEVKTSAYFYDYKSRKIKMIPNSWKTIQGIHAGMTLSRLARINWFVLKFWIHSGDLDDGTIISGFGWLREKRKVPFSMQRLIYQYTLDMKYVRDFYPDLTPVLLKSSDKTVRKWNPMLGIISVYREGLKLDAPVQVNTGGVRT
jgi:hypothetical protein